MSQNIVSGLAGLAELLQNGAAGKLRVSGGFAPTLSESDVLDVIAAANDNAEGIAALPIPVSQYVDAGAASRLVERLVAGMVQDARYVEVYPTAKAGRIRVLYQSWTEKHLEGKKVVNVRQSVAYLAVCPSPFFESLGCPGPGNLDGAIGSAVRKVDNEIARVRQDRARVLVASSTPAAPSIEALFRAAQDRATRQDHGGVPSARGKTEAQKAAEVQAERDAQTSIPFPALADIVRNGAASQDAAE